MSEKSKRFNVALCTYITETLGHIETVRTFCKTFPKWMEARKTELGKLNKMLSPEIKHADLEKELDEVLKNTLDGLQTLDLFLDAVEKLAVTSLNVFTQNQAVQLPKDSEHVQVIIIYAKLICPLLLEFKRDAKVFFLPKPQNVEVQKYQFNRYIQTSKMIFDIFEKSNSVFALMMNEVQVDINMDLPESDIQDMLCRINQLNEIRMDPNFRMVFLFQEKSCSDFIKEVQNRQPRMRTFLQDLEQCAIQLDRMNKGAKISSITGSSVGAVGGVLSIVGLALSPVTAGASLGLLIGGTAMGILSGTNSAVTTFTELAVNRTQENKVNEVFQKFMEDMQSIQDCLGEVIRQPTADIEVGFYKDMCSGFKKVGSVGLSIRSLVKDASDVKLIKSKNLITGSGKMVAQESKALSNAPKMASEIPEVSQAAFKGSLGLSKTARAGAMALNALFLGMDIYSICQDSISLAKANKTETSQFIRARASLWSSEIDSWQKICDSLNEGLKTSDKMKSVLEMPFYPEMKRQERDRHRESASFENKQRDRELQPKRDFYLFIVVLGGLLGFAAWVCDTFSNYT